MITRLLTNRIVELWGWTTKNLTYWSQLLSHSQFSVRDGDRVGVVVEWGVMVGWWWYWLYTHVYVCMCMCICACINVYVHMCMHICVCAYVYAYVCMHMCMHMCICIRIRTHVRGCIPDRLTTDINTPHGHTTHPISTATVCVTSLNHIGVRV